MSRPVKERDEDDVPVIISSSGTTTFTYTDTNTTTTRAGIPSTNSGSEIVPSAPSPFQQATQHESSAQPLALLSPRTHEWPPPYHVNNMRIPVASTWSYPIPSSETGPYHVVGLESRSLHNNFGTQAPTYTLSQAPPSQIPYSNQGVIHLPSSTAAAPIATRTRDLSPYVPQHSQAVFYDHGLHDQVASGSAAHPTASTSRSGRSLQHSTPYNHEFELRDQTASSSQNHLNATASYRQHNHSPQHLRVVSPTDLNGLHHQLGPGSTTQPTTNTSRYPYPPPSISHSRQMHNQVASNSTNATNLTVTAPSSRYNPPIIPHNNPIHTHEGTGGTHPVDLVCDECGKSTFSRSNELRRHQRTVHGGKRWTCETCGKNFKRNDTLLRHRRTLHSDQ